MYYAYLAGVVLLSSAIGVWVARKGSLLRSVLVFGGIAFVSFLVISYGETLSMDEGTIPVIIAGFHGAALAFFGAILAGVTHFWQWIRGRRGHVS